MDTQPDLPMEMPAVFDFSEQDPWPLPAGGPIVWPEPREPGTLPRVGAALAGVLLGMVQP